MRVLRYRENPTDLQIEITVEMTREEFERTDVRTLDIAEMRKLAKTRLSVADIEKVVAEYFNCNYEMLESMRNPVLCDRIGKWVEVRRYIYYFLRTYTTDSWSEISGRFNQDHATALYHHKKIKGWIEVKDMEVLVKIGDISVMIDKYNEILTEELS